jgi:hypothetical protein
LNQEQAARGIDFAVGEIVNDVLQRIGKDMVAGANAAMTFNKDRPYERRRSPGSVRSANALDFVVMREGPRQSVLYRVKGGQEVFLRIIGLNFGVPAHQIEPSGNWELTGLNPRRINRTRKRGAPEGVTASGRLAFPATATGRYVVLEQGQAVMSPARAGYGFLEKGLEKAIQANLT